jgi:hypothetical protein
MPDRRLHDADGLRSGRSGRSGGIDRWTGLVRKGAWTSACANCPPTATIIAIGSWAYDWPGDGPATLLSFEDAMATARDSGASVQFDPATNNPHFAYH